MPTKNEVFVGHNPIRIYCDFAFIMLQRQGTAKIMARGTLISKAIGVVHKLTKMYAGVRIIDEHTSVIEMDDNRPPREEDGDETSHTRFGRPQPAEGPPRKRMVSVYEATLVYEPPAPAKSEAAPTT